MAALGISFGLTAVLALVLTGLWQVIPGTVDDNGTFNVDGVEAIPYIGLVFAYIVVTVWASICLGIKRYHDLDKSGAWLFVMLVPMVGSIIYFIQAGCLRGTTGTNRYGSDPLAV